MQVFMGGAQMPAHVAAAFAEEESNIRVKVSIPTLSIAGKKFAMNIGGETTILTKNEDGEKVNLSYINVVILDQNPNRSRTFFAKHYVSGEKQAPACYSSDGKKPDADVKTPVAATCASCPNSVKGSRIKEGREGYACEAKKRLAIWPSAMLANPALGIPPMQLILPMTSIWDKENKQNDAEGWFAWDQYTDSLRNMGVTHTGMVITRIKFDNTEHPKLLFKAVRWLDDADHAQFGEINKVKAIKNTPEVQKLLHGRLYDDEHPAPEAAKPPPAIAKPKVEDDDDGFSQSVAPQKVATPAPAPAAPIAEKKPAKPAKPVTQAAEPTKPTPPVAAVSPAASGLAALAAEWD
jgi:hypothetical protein